MRQLFALRKSLRVYGSHLNRQQRRAWFRYRLDERCLLHPVNRIRRQSSPYGSVR